MPCGVRIALQVREGADCAGVAGFAERAHAEYAFRPIVVFRRFVLCFFEPLRCCVARCCSQLSVSSHRLLLTGYWFCLLLTNCSGLRHDLFVQVLRGADPGALGRARLHLRRHERVYVPLLMRSATRWTCVASRVV